MTAILSSCAVSLYDPTWLVKLYQRIRQYRAKYNGFTNPIACLQLAHQLLSVPSI